MTPVILGIFVLLGAMFAALVVYIAVEFVREVL